MVDLYQVDDYVFCYDSQIQEYVTGKVVNFSVISIYGYSIRDISYEVSCIFNKKRMTVFVSPGQIVNLVRRQVL
jgi:hypothetical protein